MSSSSDPAPATVGDSTGQEEVKTKMVRVLDPNEGQEQTKKKRKRRPGPKGALKKRGSGFEGKRFAILQEAVKHNVDYCSPIL